MWQGVLFLEREYTVYLWDRPAGTVTLSREGLYCRITCRCDLPEDVICRLKAVGQGREEGLGVLVPERGAFVLRTRIPAKRLEGEFSFHAVPNREVLPGKFIPLSPEEPFMYLQRLKDAYLVRKNGCTGIVIKEKAGT